MFVFWVPWAWNTSAPRTFHGGGLIADFELAILLQLHDVASAEQGERT